MPFDSATPMDRAGLEYIRDVVVPAIVYDDTFDMNNFDQCMAAKARTHDRFKSMPDLHWMGAPYSSLADYFGISANQSYYLFGGD